MTRDDEFDSLPEWLRALIKKIRPNDYATWIFEPVPALQNRSVVAILGLGQPGEEILRDYINKVIGHFFSD